MRHSQSARRCQEAFLEDWEASGGPSGGPGGVGGSPSGPGGVGSLFWSAGRGQVALLKGRERSGVSP